MPNKPTFSLSIIDHRESPKYLYQNNEMRYPELVTKLDDFFVDWDEAFEQDHGKTIGTMYQLGHLGYHNLYLKSVGTEKVHYCDVDANLDCFEKEVRPLDMLVLKHKVKLTTNSSQATVHFNIRIRQNDDRKI